MDRAGPGGLRGGGLPAAWRAPRLGDRPSALSPRERRRALGEVVALWLGVNLAIRGILALHAALGLPDWVQAAVPLLFVYAPVLLCRLRGVDSYAYRLYIPAFRDLAAWGRALRIDLQLALWLLLPWTVGYHLYQSVLFGLGPTARWHGSLLSAVAYHLFFVAIPEEFFYRGYLQTRLDELFPRRFLLLGVPFGWGTLLATALFAAGHSVVHFQWWHFAIFFPGFVFALLREHTGEVLPGAFFHATCNVAVQVLDTFYGLR